MENNKDKSCQSPEAVTSKEIALAQRKMNIALVQGMNKEEIMSHNLFDDSFLSDFLSTATKTNK